MNTSISTTILGIVALSVSSTSGQELALFRTIENPHPAFGKPSLSRVAFTAGGKVVAGADLFGQITLWDASSGEKLASVKAHDDPIRSLVASSDGKLLVSGAGSLHKQNEVKAWRCAGDSLELQRSFGVEFPPGFSRDDGATWSFDGGKTFLPSHGGAGEVFALAIQPDGKSVAAAGSVFGGRGEIRLLDLESGKTQATLRGHTDIVYCLAISPNGKTAASGGRDGTWRLWNLATYKAAAEPKPAGEAVRGIAFSHDGATLAVVTAEKRKRTGEAEAVVRLIDVATDKERLTLRWGLAPGGGMHEGIAFSRDDRLLAATNSNAVRLWVAADGKHIGACVGHESAVPCLSFSPDGRTLASASFDGTIKLWDVPAPSMINPPKE